MEFRNTVEALQSNADEIVHLISVLKKQEGLKRIDIDLILDKLRSMYDLMLDIQATVGPSTTAFAKSQSEKVIASETEVLQSKKDIEHYSSEESEHKINDEILSFDGNISVDETVEVQKVKDQEKTSEEKLKERKQAARTNIEQELKKEKEEKLEAGAKKAVISDRFKTTKLTLAEELGSKKKFDDLATHLKSQGTGMSTSFGLNEKFEIISELFGGDKDKFEYTLQVTSKAGSFVDAYNYLKENFSWDMDNPHVQRLLDQIRRKLIVQRKDE
jgi:hypothetical protein